MANKGDIYKVALPNGDEYNFKDKYVRENYRALNNNDFDTINVTELNSGNIINTGAARFLNTINGSISGNAATASDSAKLNGYASDTSATNNTIARRTANGYIFATYFNQSSGAETPTSSSYIIYANSDGYFRKSTVTNMKTAMSLNNVENKSSATIRGELTSANVTTALGYTPVNKAGDTITGRIAYNNVSMPLSAGKVTSLAAGTTEIFKDGIAISNPATFYDVGWIRVTGTGESDTVLEIATGDDGGMSNCEKTVVRQYNTSNAVAREAVLLNTDGTSSFPVSVTAPKFIGNLQGTADNADKVDGYHIYYDRYVSSTQLAQPTADTIWYVKVSTANWNSNIEVIQIRTGGNNRTGSHVLYTGSRGTKWWGYGQVYSHRGLSGVYKVISNSDDVYLRFDADCTSATIYTSFTPQTLAIVDSPSGANYTEVPTYGGWYGNQITVDHIQTNNYITIQKQTVASSTFADTNPKIVFKNADGSQSGSLTWTDYDSVQSPASLTLNGNQGGEYFIAPNIKATSNIYVGSTAVSLQGHTHNYAGSSSAGGAATSLANFAVSTTTGLAVENTTNIHGYVSGLTKADWNYQQTDGAIYAQFYSASWKHQIFGDYRTGHMSVRGKNNGTWQNWLRVWDEGNLTSKAAASGGTDVSLVTTGEKATWNSKTSNTGTVTSITLKATSPIAIDSTSAITTSGTRTLSHANSGVTAGTYQSVTVNATGHVTAGAALTKVQVTTALGYTPPTSDTNTTYTIGTSGNNITLTPSSGSAQSITAPYATKAGSATDSTKLPLAGGTMTGQIMTSFKFAVAMGSRQSDATTIPDLCNDLRYSSGCCGSVSIGTAYTLNSITVAKGWYNYLWVPHRSGGNSGAASGDNCDYGSLYLSGMTLSGCYMIRYASAAIAELRNLYADNNTTYGLGTSGNNITIVAGGTTTSITAPYATSAGSAATASVASKVTTTTTNPSSVTTYYVPFAAGDGNQALLSNNGLRYSTQEGTSGAAGWGELILGNGTSTGTAGNKGGWLKLFSEKRGQAELTYTASATANTTHYLPTTGGTLLNTGTTSFTQTLTSGTKIGSIKINGTSTDIFAPSVMSSMNIKIAAGSELFNGTASNPGVTITTQNAYGFVYKAVITDTQPTNLTIFKLVNGTLTYQHSATASQRTTITYASGVLTLKCTSANSNAMVWYV